MQKGVGVFVAACLSVVLFATKMVRAASCEGVATGILECGDNESGIGHVLGLAINILSIGVGVIGVVGILVVGLQYLTAGPDEGRVRKCKQRISEIVIGLIAYVTIVALLTSLLPGGMTSPEQLQHYETKEVPGSPVETRDVEDPEAPVSPAEAEVVVPSDLQKHEKQFSLQSYSHPGGTTFDYWLNVPENATSGMPLVIYLHGDGEVNNPTRLKILPPVDYMVNKYSGSQPFVSIAPVTKVASWIDGTIPTSLKGLIDKTVSDYQINTSKIYIIGMSRGAIGTWNMVDKYPNLFAAAVPVSCCQAGGNNPVNYQHTKIRAIAGAYETNYSSCMQSFVNQINSNGGAATMETYAGQNHSTITGAIDYDSLFSWLLSQ